MKLGQIPPRGAILVLALVALAITGVGGLVVHGLQHADVALVVLGMLLLGRVVTRWLARRIGPT